jgi:heme/copper-type cytochrome/quinol oxidase subunit 2
LQIDCRKNLYFSNKFFPKEEKEEGEMVMTTMTVIVVVVVVMVVNFSRCSCRQKNSD